MHVTRFPGVGLVRGRDRVVSFAEMCHKGPYCAPLQVYECIRRLMLTAVLVFLAEDTVEQVAYSCLFAFIRCAV